MEISRSLFSRPRERERDIDAGDGGEGDDRWRRAERRKRENGERKSQGVRRSVPVDRVLDAVKRTWNPSYFFTGRLFLFCTSPSPPSVRPFVHGGARGFIVGPSAKAGIRQATEKEKERERERTAGERMQRERGLGRDRMVYAREKRDARETRRALHALFTARVVTQPVPGHKSSPACVRSFYYAFVTARAEYSYNGRRVFFRKVGWLSSLELNERSAK